MLDFNPGWDANLKVVGRREAKPIEASQIRGAFAEANEQIKVYGRVQRVLADAALDFGTTVMVTRADNLQSTARTVDSAIEVTVEHRGLEYKFLCADRNGRIVMVDSLN